MNKRLRCYLNIHEWAQSTESREGVKELPYAILYRNEDMKFCMWCGKEVWVAGPYEKWGAKRDPDEEWVPGYPFSSTHGGRVKKSRGAPPEPDLPPAKTPGLGLFMETQSGKHRTTKPEGVKDEPPVMTPGLPDDEEDDE